MLSTQQRASYITASRLFDGVRVISALLALALLQVPKALPPSRDQLFALFGRYLDALRFQAGIPGLAAAIIDSDGIAWQQAYGQQDASRSLLTRTDTPFHLDGLTQIFAATLVLRCVEDGRLTLDTPIRTFSPNSPDAAATVGQILTHTSGDPRDPTFLYRPARLDVLASVVNACTGLSFRVAVAGLLNSQAMVDSVPGPDAPKDPALLADSERYASVLERLAVPYAVDDDKRSSPSHYVPTTLTPSNDGSSPSPHCTRCSTMRSSIEACGKGFCSAPTRSPPPGGLRPGAAARFRTVTAGSLRPTRTNP